MATKKDLLLLLLDVGEHMQPYLPLMHRLIYNVLTTKLVSKPNHEVAVVLYGTKGTRHKLYDPADPAYTHVSVLRPLQNVGSHHQLAPFVFAADPPGQHGDGQDDEAADAAGAAGHIPALGVADAEADDSGGVDGAAARVAARESALFAHVEAAGLTGAGTEAAAVVGRAYRLLGPPAPDARADWADGLVVALDLLASAMAERFDVGQAEAKKLGAVRVLLVSNLVAQSEPFDDDFRAGLVDTCTNRKIALDVACLDHYVPPPPPASSAAAAGGSGAPAGESDSGLDVRRAAAGVADEDAAAPLARLPASLAAARRRNLDELHRLKSELGPGSFRHLRQPAEVLCLNRSKDVAPTTTNAVFRLVPEAGTGPDAGPEAVAPLQLNVKLYKKIRKGAVEELKTTIDLPGRHSGGAAAAAHGGPDDNDDGEAGARTRDGDDAAAGGEGGGDPGFVREVEYEDPTTGDKFSAGDHIAKGYAYGKQLVPVAEYYQEESEQLQKFREKDLSLLGFVDVAGVPLHRLSGEPYVMVGDAASSATAIAALAQVLGERNQAAVVRYILRNGGTPRLGLLTPHLSDATDVPHGLLLSTLPFAEDIRTHTFSTFRNEAEARDLPRQLAEARGEAPPPEEEEAEAGAGGQEGSALGALLGRAPTAPTVRYEKLQPDEAQQDAALALVRGLELGPCSLGAGGEPLPEALQPETTANPMLQRVYALVTSRALDPTAQLCDPDDDPLVRLVLQPHGRFWPPGAQEALRAAEQALRTRERPRMDGGPDTKRARRESGQPDAEAAAGEGDEAAEGGGAGAGEATGRRPGLVFDPSAAGGTTSGRVTRISELTAVEDFQAMLAQGSDPAAAAMRQLQELVRLLVGRSIGDQLYDKALKCTEALRAGCVATGRAGGFNAFLRDLAEWCKQEERSAFLARLVSHGVGLITAGELAASKHTRDACSRGDGGGSPAASREGQWPEFADDGGGVDTRTARAFLDQHGAQRAAEDEATLPAVVVDEEFEDMD